MLRISGLREQLGPFAAYRWAQYLSSVLGLVVVALWVFRWVRRTPQEDVQYQRTKAAWRTGVWAVVSAALIVTAGVVWIAGLVCGQEPFDRSLVYYTAVISIASAGLLALIGCLGWYLLPRRPQNSAD